MCSFIWSRHKQGIAWKEATVGSCVKDSENPHKRLLPFIPYISLGCFVLFWKLILPEGGTSHLEHLERVNAESIKGNSIYEFNNVSNKFYERENVDWSEALISWKRDWGDLISFNNF